MKCLFSVLLVISALHCAMAQTPSFTFRVTQEANPGFNLLDTIYAKSYHFDAVDTNNVEKLHIKMGTTFGGSEVFEHVIDFDQTTNLPIGFNYTRVGNDIELTVGVYHIGFFYYEAKLENAAAVFSEVATENSTTHLP